MCPREFANVPLKFRLGDTGVPRILDLGTTLGFTFNDIFFIEHQNSNKCPVLFPIIPTVKLAKLGYSRKILHIAKKISISIGTLCYYTQDIVQITFV